MWITSLFEYRVFLVVLVQMESRGKWVNRVLLAKMAVPVNKEDRVCRVCRVSRVPLAEEALP